MADCKESDTTEWLNWTDGWSKKKLSLTHTHNDTHESFKIKQYRKYFYLESCALCYGSNCEKTCGSAKKDSSATWLIPGTMLAQYQITYWDTNKSFLLNHFGVMIHIIMFCMFGVTICICFMFCSKVIGSQ